MNKSDLVCAIAETCNLSKTDANKALESVISTIGETLKKGESISLVGFGQFLVKHREERQCRNPKTGELITAPASKTVSFKAGKNLKENINK